jgi:queuine tRNA-ribosyltransferase
MKYIIKNRNKCGVAAEVITKHGKLKTPLFISCATKGAIKGASVTDMQNNNTQMILTNTVHMLPNSEYVKEMGGIHKFMNWKGPMLADSGGFQMFSWNHGGVVDEIKGVSKRKLNNNTHKNSKVKFFPDGCEFTYPNSNLKVLLNPERSMRVQIDLGVDFCVALDECTPSSLDYFDTRLAMRRSHEWEYKSLEYFNKNKQKHQELLGIVQGGIHKDLREESVNFVKNNNFWGYCIGGSLGKTKEEMYEVVKYTCGLLNGENKKYIHLLGIGETADILNLVEYGIDSFDCVHSTRIGRHGCGLLSYFDNNKDFINLNNNKYKYSMNPIDDTCKCNTCKTYSRGYLNYLLRVKEINGITAIVSHNVFRMNRLMEEIRESIINDNLWKVKNKWLCDKG